MAVFEPAERADREDAAAFTGRVARWDAQGPVRLRADGNCRCGCGRTTPFDALVTRAVRGRITPADVTVHAGNLLSALAVATAEQDRSRSTRRCCVAQPTAADVRLGSGGRGARDGVRRAVR